MHLVGYHTAHVLLWSCIYKTCFPLIFLCYLQTWYPYYQKILPKGDSQPVMTEQLFIGSLHEHGNLLRVNIAEDKMKDIVRLSLSETHVSQTLQKLAHAIYRDFFSPVKIENFIGKKLIFSYFCSKHRLWVHVRTASAIGIPLQTPVLLYKSGVQGGIHYTDMFS